MPSSLRMTAARALLGTMPLVMRTIGRATRSETDKTSQLLPQQFRLLSAIARRPRTLGQIARMQGVTPATATTLVTTLENRGWVTREHDQDDRRRVVVSLTREGEARLAKSRAVVEAAMAENLATLSAEQLQRLVDGLEVLEEIGLPEPPQ
jgi:DNA-binding MarR family transcriptional regulator